MNSWILPSHLIDSMIVSRTADAIFFVFDRELALSHRSIEILGRGIVATSKAMGIQKIIEIPTDRLMWLASTSDKAKLVLKLRWNASGSQTEIFERD